MIKNIKFWQSWEQEYLKKEQLNIEQRFRLLDAMYDHACALKVFPPQNPMEDLELKVEMVRRLHVSKAA